MSDPDCLFCKIVAKEIPSDVVVETDNVIAFKDINPGAPTHVLVIPKDHIKSASYLEAKHGALLTEMFDVMEKIGTDAEIGDGYRIVTNVGPKAGQSVFHLHFHVLGGRPLSWPPG